MADSPVWMNEWIDIVPLDIVLRDTWRFPDDTKLIPLGEGQDTTTVGTLRAQAVKEGEDG